MPTVLGLAGPSPKVCPKPCFLVFLLPPVLGGFPGKAPPHISINLHQSHQRGLHKKCWQPTEALSALDPVFLATGSPFLCSINKPQDSPHVPFPSRFKFALKSTAKDSRCGLILAKALIPIILRDCTHYPLPPTRNLIRVMWERGLFFIQLE